MSLHKLLLVVFLGCIQPISSPMMKRILGFCCCCAAAGVLAAATATNDASRPRQSLLVTHGLFPQFWLPKLSRQPAPDCSSNEASARQGCVALRLEAQIGHAGLVGV